MPNSSINVTVKIFGDGSPPANILNAGCAVEHKKFGLTKTGPGTFEGTHAVEDDGQILVVVGITAPSFTNWRFTVSLSPPARPNFASSVNTVPAGSLRQGDAAIL